MTREENRPGADPREIEEMVRRVVRHHFGTPPTRVANQAGGRSNYVYQVSHPEGEFVIRIGVDPWKLNAFLKEQWATRKAREAGVPAPEILEVGCGVVPHPYTISLRARGHEAQYHPQRPGIIRQMGKIAARIHSIRTSGFGGRLDAPDSGRFRCATWPDFLDRELAVEAKVAALERHRMLSPAVLASLRSVLAEIRTWQFDPTLNHGDLRLKNVLVDDDGRIVAILDWEHCASNPAPHWELSTALHDRSIDEKQEFLAGYGLSAREVTEAAPAVKAFNLVNYAPEIERLVEAGDRDRLEQYRLRLSGALDLYSL